MRSRPSGFFIRDLVDGVVGEGWREQNRILDADLGQTAHWVDRRLLDPAIAQEIRGEFHQGGRVLHVFLNDVLQAERADGIHRALGEARFTRHHHQPYALHVARRENQLPSALTQFMDWLASPEAAAFHQWLSGWPRGGASLRPVQVQTSRMREGEFFPPHHDTADEGLAVVYGFSRPWEQEFGGVLAFPREDGAGDELRAPVRFNSLLLFRPKDVLHRVEAVTQAAGDNARYTVTAFYLSEGEDLRP